MKRYDQILFERHFPVVGSLDSHTLLSYLEPKITQWLTKEEILTKLALDRPLKIKFGIDPTAPIIHLGHLVPLVILRLFLLAGHHTDLIIGDFTAQIGDPSGRTTERKTIDRSTISNNYANYQAFLGNFIELDHLNIIKNSSWLDQITLPEWFKYMTMINLSEATQREDFRKRVENSQPVSMAEVSYGMLMGIDSIKLNTDIEISGLDQLLNVQQCRSMMKDSGMVREGCLIVPIIEGTTGDGRKMSKSYGNFIAIDLDDDDLFGKVMATSDKVIADYYLAFMMILPEEVKDIQVFCKSDPLEAKKQLATLLIAIRARDIDSGLRARQNFERIFSNQEILDQDFVQLQAAKNQLLFELLSHNLDYSKTALRTLFDQGGVKMINQDQSLTKLDQDFVIERDIKLKIGKRHYYRVSI